MFDLGLYTQVSDSGPWALLFFFSFVIVCLIKNNETIHYVSHRLYMEAVLTGAFFMAKKFGRILIYMCNPAWTLILFWFSYHIKVHFSFINVIQFYGYWHYQHQKVQSFAISNKPALWCSKITVNIHDKLTAYTSNLLQLTCLKVHGTHNADLNRMFVPSNIYHMI